MEAKTHEILFSLKNFKDKGRSNTSMFLYGFGDGGQGPTWVDQSRNAIVVERSLIETFDFNFRIEMLERLRRMEDTDECPKFEKQINTYWNRV